MRRGPPAAAPMAITCAVLHHRQPISEFEYRVHVVLDDQHRAPDFQRRDQRDDLTRFGLPHAGQRFVEQNDARLGRQHHGDFELALLAVAELLGDHLRSRRQARPGSRRGQQSRTQSAFCCAAEHPQRLSRPRLRGEPDILDAR